jgi:mxaK protein
MAGLTLPTRRTLPALAWIGLALSLAGAGACLLQWQRVHRDNRMIADASLIEQPPSEEAPAAVSYAAGWLYERAGHRDQALQRYALAENAADEHLAARARFALGNLYLDIGLRAADVAAGGSHVRGLAQQELAREAYRGALRLDPELRDARYNLELLERLSPERRTEGWSRRNRQLLMQPGKEQGWATMQENAIRGLP